MSELHLPWLEILILVPMGGAGHVSRLRDLDRAHRHTLMLSATALVIALAAWIDFVIVGGDEARGPIAFTAKLFGREGPVIDQLSAPLLPLLALVHLMTSLATLRTKLPRFSFARSLLFEATLLATFCCRTPWGLVILLAGMALPVLWELKSRGASVRLFALHTALYLTLLVAGCALGQNQELNNAWRAWSLPLVTAGVLVRCGVWPIHLWVRNLFDDASFGTALLYVTPMTGVYAAMRLVLPTASESLLQVITYASLATALYAAGLALVQTSARRFFSYLLLSYCSMVLVGVELATPIGLTGSLCLWWSVALALTGFGLTLRSLEAREGRMSLDRFHGLFDQTPVLAGFFLLTGLASVGFPGTIGFVATELLIEGAVQASSLVGAIVVFIVALNGIAILKVFFRLFTGSQHMSSISLYIRPQERVAVLVLSALIIGGGLFPQPGIASRYAAAKKLLELRGQTRLEAAGSRPPTPLTFLDATSERASPDAAAPMAAQNHTTSNPIELRK